MITVFFLYGLAFIVMAIIIFTSAKKRDILNISPDIWLVGCFGLMHGINEWLDMLILMGRPFNTGMLSVIASLTLPISFLFLVIYGLKRVADEKPGLAWMRPLWCLCAIAWLAVYAIEKDFLIAGIAARYFICIPGTVLTSLSLYIAISKADRANTPRTVFLFAWGAVITFLLYAFFSGLVVPKSGFLLSSIINYPNFILIFKVPVQLFRMACALILAVFFFGLISFFYREDEKVRTIGGLRRKVILIICTVSFVIIITGISLGYLLGKDILTDTILRERTEIARLLEIYIEDTIDVEASHIATYANSPLLLPEVVNANLEYESGKIKPTLEYFLDMDKKWTAAGSDSQLIKKHLDNYVSGRLKAILRDDKDIVEIFITDKFGGLVSSSGKTSDFYQADEEWWQKAYNNGLGKIFVGDIELDMSTNTWVMPIAVPIKDDAGNLIGVCKAGISAKRFFGRLENFNIGKTGHAALVGSKGYILYHHDIVPTTEKFANQQDLDKLAKSEKKYAILHNLHLNEPASFVIYRDVVSPLIKQNEIKWKIFIIQSAEEVFEALSKLVFFLIVITIFLIGMTIPVGLLFGYIFVKPIKKLRVATEQVSKGNMDYVIDVKTGDEIEELADAFGKMVHSIKNKQAVIILANEELEALSKDLEKKVEERTKDLSQAQEATLNILEDLTEAKANLEKYAKELEEAIKIKSEFTSTVSHELRTPLAAIKESIAIVLDGTSGPVNDDQKGFLDLAKRNVDRLVRIINDILDFQKLESGKITFNIQENNINDVVKETGNMMAPLAKNKNLAFIFELDEDLPQIKFDKDKIIQVLTNLINNAIKFTDKGSIVVRTSKDGNNIRVSVKDTGPGIREEDMPKLFQQFEQLGKGIDRKIGGTGLGLVISKEIIARHKGKIWAESKLGEGAVFHFVLPIKERRG